MRASLLASATETTLNGFFAMSVLIQFAMGVGLCLVSVANDGCGADNEQSSQVSVSLFGDASKLHFSAGRMLLWRQTEPGGKLPARPELIGIGDGGGDGCRRNGTDAGDRREPATRFAVGMPGEKLAIERRDLLGKRHDLPDHGLQRSAGIGWQGILVRQRLLSQLRQFAFELLDPQLERRDQRLVVRQLRLHAGSYRLGLQSRLALGLQRRQGTHKVRRKIVRFQRHEASESDLLVASKQKSYPTRVGRHVS